MFIVTVISQALLYRPLVDYLLREALPVALFTPNEFDQRILRQGHLFCTFFYQNIFSHPPRNEMGTCKIGRSTSTKHKYIFNFSDEIFFLNLFSNLQKTVTRMTLVFQKSVRLPRDGKGG